MFGISTITNSDSKTFSDRPGTRIRITFPGIETKKPGLAAIVFGWILKIVYAAAAGVFCVALSSYMPVGGAALGPFVPPDCVALVHASSGAELHRAISACPAVNDLLDDADTGAFVSMQLEPQKSVAAEIQDEGANVAPTLRARLGAMFQKFDALPWYASWAAPKRAADFYPFLGDECALAFVPSNSGEKKSPQRIVFFSRLNGSRGAMLRMALPFIRSKDFQLFDLGGGLIAVGINGAQPALGAHALPRVLADDASTQRAPLLRVAFDTKKLIDAGASPMAARAKLNRELEAEDSALGRISDEGVPDSILYALVKPPGVMEMLNLTAPPDVVRADIFAGTDEQGGGVVLRGRLTGELPPLPDYDSGKKPAISSATEFLSGGFSGRDVMAEFVLPVNARELFISHVVSAMKIEKNQEGLTKNQRRWIARFKKLKLVGAEPDLDLWPSIGHVAKIWMHESKPEVTGVAIGTLKVWMPFTPTRPEDAMLCASDLARARWDFLFENDEKVSAKPPYVRRFHKDNSAVDSYVLANGLNYAPAWQLSPKGLRLTSSADLSALWSGPTEKDFPPQPERLDAYSIKFDGARMATTAEIIASDTYEDLEYDLGSAQKFTALYPHSAMHIRLARKWMGLLGAFELAAVPDQRGAELHARWRPGRIIADSSAPSKKSNSSEDVKGPAAPDAKNPDDDVAPPPPPPAN